jgi:hypothetical protein
MAETQEQGNYVVQTKNQDYIRFFVPLGETDKAIPKDTMHAIKTHNGILMRTPLYANREWVAIVLIPVIEAPMFSYKIFSGWKQ